MNAATEARKLSEERAQKRRERDDEVMKYLAEIALTVGMPRNVIFKVKDPSTKCSERPKTSWSELCNGD